MRLPGDSLRAVLDSVFAAPAYRWVEAPDPLAFLGRWWERLRDWLETTREMHPAVFQGLLLLLATVLAAIVVHAAYIFYQTVRAASSRERAPTAAPPEPGRDAAWFLAAADQVAARGRYPEALGLAFEGLVRRLDDVGSVRWGSGKTAGDYAREARLQPADRDRLSRLVGVLYRGVYGGGPCGPDEYRAVRGAAAGEWRASAG